eukprot:NODE_4380_length_668_cov_90.095315_g3737_i0.p1 GENE.NODE_4380_length_668_cov_90.095315_g3737_i0~~NODE_4380_length_668_cov_90.095315_g3737_i0.p1  ORF type:complete len:146 (-),score=37.85 NODE_4380_length_668_cov_90.095315_g3737_i0:230-640(-)
MGPNLRSIMGSKWIPRTVGFQVDDRSFQESVMWVQVQNNRICPKSTLAAPRARVDDGVMDLIFVKAMPKMEFYQLMKKFHSGQHFNHPSVVHMTFRSLAMSNMSNYGACPVSVDSLVAGTDPIRVDVMPSAFEVVV